MPAFSTAKNPEHSFRVNAMANAYDARARELVRRREAMLVKKISTSEDPALILMKELVSNIAKKMGGNVITKTDNKTFESLMEKILKKKENSDSDTATNYLAKDRIRATIIFAGPSTELEVNAKRIKEILNQDPRIRNDGHKYDKTKKGYKDYKLYFSAQGVNEIDLQRPIVNKYTDMNPTTGKLHEDQTLGKELRVQGKKQRVAESYELIVISANTAIAKDGLQKVKGYVAGDPHLQSLFQSKNPPIWNDNKMEQLGPVGHEVYKARLLYLADEDWHTDFNEKYYEYIEHIKNSTKKTELEKILSERKNKLEIDKKREEPEKKTYPVIYTDLMLKYINKMKQGLALNLN